MRKESNTRYMSSSIFLPERTQKEIERSITHLDIDQEMNFYRQRRMMRDPKTGLIGPVSIGKEGPGTLFTGIPCELLYHDTGTANTSCWYCCRSADEPCQPIWSGRYNPCWLL